MVMATDVKLTNRTISQCFQGLGAERLNLGHADTSAPLRQMATCLASTSDHQEDVASAVTSKAAGLQYIGAP